MKADDAFAGLLDDAPLGHAEETDVEVVQALALRRRARFGSAVGIGQVALLRHRHASEAVVRRIAEDDEDGLLLFDLVRRFRFCLEFGNRKRELLVRLFEVVPSR